MIKIFLHICLLIICCSSFADNKIISVPFSLHGADKWEEKVFDTKTLYSIIKSGTEEILKAKSDDSGSAIYKEIEINVKQYQYINWSWKITERLHGNNERTKSGDDYAGRFFVIHKSGWELWDTKAICYVWSNADSVGEHWNDPFTSNVVIVPVADPKNKLSVWYNEKRDVYEDFKKFFGIELNNIDAIAIMTDTDNSHQKALTYYKNIYFSLQ